MDSRNHLLEIRALANNVKKLKHISTFFELVTPKQVLKYF